MGVNQDHSALKIFLSSSSDVKAERRIVSRIVSDLAARYQRQLIIELVDWEADFYEANDSFQAQIPNAADSDLVVCVFHRRVGTELNPEEFRRSDGSLYEGGAVYEFECAFESRRSQGTPDLFVFRKSAPVLYTEGPGRDEEIRQYELLQRFLKRWTESEEGHLTGSFNVFEDTEDFRGQFKHFFERWLSEWTAERGISLQQWDIDVDGSPFVGLAPFTKSHQRVFFGRENEMYRSAEALELAARSEGGLPSLLILGASGAGKSSFLQAALIPYLTTPGVIDSVECWLRADLRLDPQESRPLLRLAEQLFKASVVTAAHFNIDSDDKAVRSILGRALTSSVFDTPEKLADQFVQRPSHANEIVEHVVLSAAKDLSQADTGLSVDKVHLLLSVDQIETLVANDAGTEAELFLQVIESMVQCTNVWLIGAARNDFYARIQQSKPLRKLLAVGARLDLLHPDPSQIRTMVEGPARAAGLSYEVREGEKLSEVLIDAVEGAEVLPLLQVALSEMFSHLLQRNSSNIIDTVLRFEDYERLGNESDLPGLLGAIDRYAEQSWQNHTSENKETKAKILESDLRTLIRQMALPATATSSTVSRPINQELYATTRSRQSLVELLVKDRLLVATSYDGRVWLRPCHDALLRHWKRADQQIATDLNHLRWRESLRQLAVHWQSAQVKRKDHLDLPVASLAGALSLRQEFGSDLNGEPIVQGQKESLADYVDAVARRDKQKRVRRRMKYASLGVIVGAVLLFVFNLAKYNLVQLNASSKRFIESMQFAAKNELENGNARTATLLSLRAITFNEKQKHAKANIPIPLVAQLHASVHAENEILFYRVGDAFSTFTNQDSKYLLVLKKDRKSIVSFKKGSPIHLTKFSIEKTIVAVALSPNDDRIVLADAFGSIYYFNASSGNLIQETKLAQLNGLARFNRVTMSWSKRDKLAISFGKTRLLVNADNYQVEKEALTASVPLEMSWNPKGTELLIKGVNGIVIESTLIESELILSHPEINAKNLISRAGWMDSKSVFATTDSGVLFIWNANGEFKNKVDFSEHLDGIARRKSFQFEYNMGSQFGYAYQSEGKVVKYDFDSNMIEVLGNTPNAKSGDLQDDPNDVFDGFQYFLFATDTMLVTEDGFVTERSVQANGIIFKTEDSLKVRDYGVGPNDLISLYTNVVEDSVNGSSNKIGISHLKYSALDDFTIGKVHVFDVSHAADNFSQNPIDLNLSLLSVGTALKLVSTKQGALRTLHVFDEPITSIAWHPSGEGFAVGLDKGGVRYFPKLENQNHSCSIDVSGTRVTFLDWSPVDDLLAISQFQEFNVLDVHTCKTIIPEKIQGSTFSNEKKWNFNGNVIASNSPIASDYELSLIFPKAKIPEIKLDCSKSSTGHSGSFSWSTDGQNIVMDVGGQGCRDFNIIVWDVNSGVIKAGFQFSGFIEKLSFVRDNTAIVVHYIPRLNGKVPESNISSTPSATGSKNYTGHIAIISYQGDYASLLSKAKDSVLRYCFSDKELRNYLIQNDSRCLEY